MIIMTLMVAVVDMLTTVMIEMRNCCDGDDDLDSDDNHDKNDYTLNDDE